MWLPRCCQEDFKTAADPVSHRETFTSAVSSGSTCVKVIEGITSLFNFFLHREVFMESEIVAVGSEKSWRDVGIQIFLC